MSLYKYLNRIRRLDGMIRRKNTGPPPELARKLNISERWLYIFLDELREELDCPTGTTATDAAMCMKNRAVLPLDFRESFLIRN